MTRTEEARCGRYDTLTGSGVPWVVRAMLGGWARSRMGHPGRLAVTTHPVLLGLVARLPLRTTLSRRRYHLVVEERRIKPAARADSGASRTNLGGMTEQTGRHAGLGGARSTAASTGDARRLRA